MGSVISLYEELVNTEDDRVRMRLIAEALDRLEHRPVPDNVVTRQNLNETELRLQKEIEQVHRQMRIEAEEDKVEIMKWVLGLVAAQVAVVVIGAVVALA